MHRWASAHICTYICVYGTHIYLQIQTPINISLVKEQTGNNIGEVCINSLGWYDANTDKRKEKKRKKKKSFLWNQLWRIMYSWHGWEVRWLDGAKMCTQVSFEAPDGSQVFEGKRKGVPDRWSREWELALYRSMRGRGGIKLLDPYLPVDLVKSERMYSGVSPLHTLNIITDLLHFSCFFNGRSLRVFSLSSVGTVRLKRMNFAAQQWREFSFVF